MSLLGRAAVFVLREITGPTLEEIGKQVGTAVGNVLGRRIDPKHGQDSEDDDDEKKGKDEPDA